MSKPECGGDPAAEVEVRCGCAGVDWARVVEILRRVGMAHVEPEAHRRAFEASHTVVFAYQGDLLVGFGRALSDGVYQAAVYDVAVLPEFQGQGVGKTVMQHILERLAPCTVILYAMPGKEAFYRSLGFRCLKTGMARFTHAERMRDRGFTE